MKIFYFFAIFACILATDSEETSQMEENRIYSITTEERDAKYAEIE